MGHDSGTRAESASVPLERRIAPTTLARAFSDSDLLREMDLGVTLVAADPELPVLYCNEGFRRSRWVAGEGGVEGPLAQLVGERHRRAVQAAHRKVVRTGLPARLRAIPGRGEVELLPLSWGSGAVDHVLGLWTEPGRARRYGRRAQQPILRALQLVTEHLEEGRPVEPLLGWLSRILAGLVGASRVAFWRYDPERRVLSLEPEPFGFAPDRPPRSVLLRPGEDGALTLGQAVLWSRADPGRDRLSDVLGDALGAGDAIVAPWKSKDGRLGVVIACDSRRPGGFSTDDAWVLQTTAAAAALVVDHRRADDALTVARTREVASLRRQIDQSLQLEQMKTNLLRLVSHELRTPLTVLRGYLSMIEEGSLPPRDLPSVLPLLRAQVEEMGHLIDEIMEAARLEESAIALAIRRVDLREVVTAAVRSLEPLAGPDHPLRLGLPQRSVLVRGDRSRLTMILTALIHNAIKYSPGGGEIRVDCRASTHIASVAVSDHGVGIVRRDRPRLFTKFGRIVTAETKDIPGTGLGLYLARDLARRHGGDIRVRSRPGQGSTFTLRLPLSVSGGGTGEAV